MNAALALLLLSGAAAPAGPSLPIASPAVWLRKGTASGATWPDASGNARNGVLVGTPTIGASSVTFNGSTQYLTIAASGGGSTYSLYLRMKQISWALDARIASGPIAQLRQATSVANLAFSDSDATNYAENSDGALGVFQRVGLIAGSAFGCVISINGIETFEPGATTGDSIGSLAIAASLSGTNPANLELQELILYAGVHNPAQRAQMDAYLAAL